MKPLRDVKKRIEAALGAKEHSLTAAIGEAIDSAIAAGQDAEDIVRLLVEAGYAEPYGRKVVSNLLLRRGIRRRASGAGLQPNPKSLELLQYAQRRYGAKEGKKILHAAYHQALKAEKRDPA